MRLDLHSEDTWPTALITMALCEVLTRTFLLLWRYLSGRRELAPSSGRDDATETAAGPVE